MIRQRFTPCFLLILFLALAQLGTTSAQNLPATPVPRDAPTGVLAEFRVDALPTPHAEVWFLRMALDSGGSLPAGKQVGPVVVYTESGAVTLATDQPVAVSTADETAPPGATAASPVAEGFETVLQPGESALVDDGTTLTAVNTTPEPASFLVVFIYAAEREVELGEGGGEPVGLTQQGISFANAEFPIGPGKLTIERIIVEPGDSLESDSGHGMSIGGVDLGAIEQGLAEVTFEMGSSWLWPDILNEVGDRQPIDPGATIVLTTGDGYSTYDGSSTWTVMGDESLVLLRMVVVPGS
jgi:hypothetical protein